MTKSLVPCYEIAAVDLGPPVSLPIIGLKCNFFFFFVRGVEGGRHIYEAYESYLLKKQGFQDFKLKQREHVTLKCFVFGQKELHSVPG